jgi:hypothetical protein
MELGIWGLVILPLGVGMVNNVFLAENQRVPRDCDHRK